MTERRCPTCHRLLTRDTKADAKIMAVIASQQGGPLTAQMLADLAGLKSRGDALNRAYRLANKGYIERVGRHWMVTNEGWRFVRGET